MTGLEKILTDIRQESETAAAALLEAAQKEADGIRAAAQAETDTQLAAIAAQRDQQLANEAARAESAAQLQKRQQLLAGKQEILQAVLQKALAAAEALPDAQYFETLQAMALGAVHPGSGVMFFNARDLARLPKDFEKKLNKALPVGAELTISDQPRAMESGFILSYDGIEENASFDAVLAARRDVLVDRMSAILFA